nr:hypothetical protein [uncultured bacterium]
MYRIFPLLFTTIFFVGSATAADVDPELKQFQGRWEVVELVEDGKVIPREAIREWLPSGGQFEISENAILFTSPDDGKKHAKVFSLDATQYPRGIDLSTRDKKDGHGIYRFDGEQLIICFADPEESQRPKEFSAKEGSKQVLMTLERMQAKDSKKPAAKPQQTGVTAKVLTDAQAKQLLTGSWKYADNQGVLYVNFKADGTFSTVREVKELRLFQKVFVRTPVSTGKWSISNGTLTFNIEKSVQRERVNKEFDFAIRSITDRDFIFVDYIGRVGQAAKIQ